MNVPGARRRTDSSILHDLQDAVSRMHVVSLIPRVVVLRCARSEGPRPMTWQVLFERSLGGTLPKLGYRGASASMLRTILKTGFDEEPTLSRDWSHDRLDVAMKRGPVVQAFRSDRLPDDVAYALVGILIFEEDGLELESVRGIVRD
jgi:hypothetical protein